MQRYCVLQGKNEGTGRYPVEQIVVIPNMVTDAVEESSENRQSLLNTVRTAWETPSLLEELGAGARAEFESKYTEDVNYKILMDIYEQALILRSRN